MAVPQAKLQKHFRRLLLLIFVTAFTALPQSESQQTAPITTPLGPWVAGIATNYGSAYDGTSPYDESFGTSKVSSVVHAMHSPHPTFLSSEM